MASNVSIVSISTALRDSPFTETDAQCTVSFNEVNASAFRVLQASVPISQYTFNDTNKALKWENEVQTNFLEGDYLDMELAWWSSLGTFSGPFVYREFNDATNETLYFKSGVIQFKFYDDINLIRSQVNPEAGSTAIGRVDFDVATNKMVIFMNPAPDGVTVRASFEVDSGQMLGINGQIMSRRTGSAPTVPALIAATAVDLTPKPDGRKYYARFTPTPNVTYSAGGIVNGLQTALAASITPLGSSFPFPWFTNFSGRVALADSNYTIKFTSNTTRFYTVTGILDTTWVPSSFKNNDASPTRTQISANPINVSITTPVWIRNVFDFATDRLYTKEDIVSALNTHFTSYSVVWSTAHSRFSLVNGESSNIRLFPNDVLGLRAPNFITVLKATGYSSPFTFDLSGLTDCLSIGLPTLFHTGRTSQGAANAPHTRRRDIVLTLANTGAIAFGSYLTFQTQDPTFISLGTPHSITSLRICLYDQLFNPIATTNGQPIHLTLEFV
jgi:hypothetical protein